MRWGLAQIAVLSIAWLMASLQSVHAHQIQSEAPCPSAPGARDEQPSGPEISIAEVNFSGFIRMPVSEQDQIAASIKQLTHGNTLDGVIDEALERARHGWQDQGYFRVQVSGDAKTLTSSPVGQRVALRIQVDEGFEYSLSGITFRHSKAISNLHALRNLFPIQDGDTFSPEKIGTGLENLRKAYGNFGYLNFTSVPETRFDDANKRILLTIDLDEGQQFYVSSVEVLGLGEDARQEVLKDLSIKSGQIYNSRLWEQILIQYGSMLPDCECRTQRRLDDKSGALALTLDFRPCSADE